MLKRNFAATTEQIGSPRILIDQPHFLKPVDWASVIDEYQSDIEEKEKKDKLNALANALQTGDEEIINSALAAQNPTGYAERLHQMKVAKEKREQELADKEVEHQRNLALESHRSDLATRRDSAAHERTLALEQLKRDWLFEDKAREREQALEDAEAKRQDFYAEEAFKKDLEYQYKKENPEKLPNALYYANELDKLDPNNPAHQPRIKILEGLLAKEMAITGGKTNVAKEIQLLNLRASLDPNDPAQAEQIKLIDSVLNNQKQDTPAKEIQIANELATLDPNNPVDAQKIEYLKKYLPENRTQNTNAISNEEKKYRFLRDELGMSKEEAADAILNPKTAPTGELGYLLSLKEKLDTNNPEGAEKLKAINSRIDVITKDPTAAMNYSFGQSYGEKLAKTREAYDTFVANLPNMENVIKSLYGYADDATYTMFGSAYDEAMKQLGGMSTKGSIAKAKFESTARAVLYPLLRPTFGSQFTENEGERLISLLGAAGQTPEEKKAVLVGFLTDYVNKMISNAEILKSAGVVMPDFPDDIKERILKYGANPTSEDVANIINNSQTQDVKIKGIRRVK